MSSHRRPLAGLLVAQFLGAFNDYAWKIVVTLLLQRELRGESAVADAQRVAGLVTVAFLLPLTLGALPAIPLVDRFSKRSVLVATKALELLLMLAATASLVSEPAGGTTALVIVGAMGLQSALFSPAKYGILPQLVPHERLSRANGAIELATFVAIVAGMACGPVLLHAAGDSTWWVGALLSGLALVGLLGALAVPSVAAANSGGSALSIARTALGSIRADRVLRLAVLGNALFMGVASLLMQNLQVYAKVDLGLAEHRIGLPLATLSIGIGVGSLLAGRISGRKVELGLLPLGALLLALFSVLFGLMLPALGGTLVLMGLTGLAGGLLVVPLNALVQWRAPAETCGAVVATSNFLVYAASLAGGALGAVLADAGADTTTLFLVSAAIVVLGAGWALWLVPQALLRLALVLLTHSIYRLRIRGLEHIPEKGGALLVPNHVSFVDGLFLIASTDRPVRFLVDAPFFEQRFIGTVLRWLDAIPISSTGGPRMILRGLRAAGDYLDQGHLVCIFAEGQISRTGMLLPFRRGLERIVKGREAPVIPVYLEGVWGSIFSFDGGRFVWKLPRRLPYPVSVSFGAPLPSGTPVHEVRRAVQLLGQDAWHERYVAAPPLHHTFVTRARTRPMRFLFADATRPRVTRIRALAGAIALGRALAPHWRDQAHVGILLPPSVGGALVNLAASFAGRAAVNLNYTTGRAGMSSAAKQAQLRTVVTSRVFLERANLELPEGVEPIWIDDLAKEIGALSRLSALALAWLAPTRLLERLCGATRSVRADDIVTVIFSSGSTGEPKGVMLAHSNIASNCAALEQTFHVRATDKVLGILPFFHSFGYTATIWFPATSGLGAVFHPSPIDAPAIGDQVERHGISFLLATPTLLSMYLRRVPPQQFGSLRLVLAGAEKLTDRLADAFQDHFGIRPLEGYGTTECAPVVAASQADYRAAGFYQPGWRRGYVGQPLPGIVCRIVDPDTFSDLPPNTPGMLLVRGPNVMKGYLGRDDLTQKALRDGWYVTGDIALLDDDSFLKITDRLARFSKIGGEMVPHGRVEDELHTAANSSVQVFLVTAIPDESKGERLAVLTTLPRESLPSILAALSASGLPNLFLPRLDAFVTVDALPVLGTGKVDLRSAKDIALRTLTPR
jgi:acyl-[acyl-carrier-protein]-phospholipid O-acyltransferase/long-chain-fatty-acid--[acyl-carrier-protein] ligase